MPISSRQKQYHNVSTEASHLVYTNNISNFTEIKRQPLPNCSGFRYYRKRTKAYYYQKHHICSINIIKVAK